MEYLKAKALLSEVLKRFGSQKQLCFGEIISIENVKHWIENNDCTPLTEEVALHGIDAQLPLLSLTVFATEKPNDYLFFRVMENHCEIELASSVGYEKTEKSLKLAFQHYVKEIEKMAGLLQEVE